jgi:hypothetical protein
MLVVLLVPFDDDSFRRGGLINEVVLPFVWFAFRRIGALIDVSPKRSIHVNNILLRDIKVLRDQSYLIGV